MFQIAANIAVPAGSPYQDGGIYPTWWTAGADLTNLTYHFLSSQSPSMTWVDVAALQNSAQQNSAQQNESVMSLNPRQEGLVGDISGHFRPTELALIQQAEPHP